MYILYMRRLLNIFHPLAKDQVAYMKTFILHLEQYYPIELPAMIEMFFICTVEYIE